MLRQVIKLTATALMLCCVALAGTQTAATCSYADVNTAVSAAANGDTVLIPGGTCNWGSSSLSITKGITIQPVAGQTVTINATGTSSGTFHISNTGDNPVRISGDTGTVPDTCKSTGASCGLRIMNAQDPSFQKTDFAITGPARKFRIDHIYANQSDSFLCSNCGGASGQAWGVVDHSWIQNFGRAYFAQDRRSADGPFGQAAWTEFTGHEASIAGSGQMVFFEDNTFTYNEQLPGGQWQATVYGQYGGKGVFRYNTFQNAGHYFDAHGDLSPATNGYGTILYEIYNNTFASDGPYNQEGKLMYLRGGQFLIHDNAFTSSAQIIQLTVYYSTDLTAHRVQNTFIWNNTINGSAQTSSIVDIETSNGGYPQYYLRAPTTGDVYAGYTPYTYPHPLRGGGSRGSLPATPTGLTAAVH